MTGKNPYDFESEEEGEVRETTPEIIHDEQKKKSVRKQEPIKQRSNSGNFNQLNEIIQLKRRPHKLDLIKEQDPMKFKSISDDEQLQTYLSCSTIKNCFSTSCSTKNTR